MKITTKLGILVLSISLFLLITICEAQAAPRISANCYCLLDTANRQVLAGQNIDAIRPIASTTKIMTAILAAEYCSKEEIATVSNHAAKTAPYTMDLKSGQTLTIEELLKISLMRSANDAAVVIAEHVAGSEEFFAHLMNLKAFCLGALNTHFQNSSGLPAEQHYSTAYDLTLISSYSLQNPETAKWISTAETYFQHPSNKQPTKITNTNPLLQTYAGANGVKTGTTDAAGPCLIGSAVRNQRQLIAVILNSSNRSGDCSKLLNYGFEHTTEYTVIDKAELFKEIFLSDGENPILQIYPSKNIVVWQEGAQLKAHKQIDMNYQIPAPVIAGEKIGRLDLFIYSKYIGSVDLVAGNNVYRQRRPWLNAVKNLLKKE
ncbi:MAG: D-alanyl-D-alanine carboxypeptidase [Syntrophomonadaceae bacterium]|jgi:D-alanyl-D-alanine carboxypeptidase (penicillin-binding protein 5/6)|nr:D-alanyl-D-alanine carboxypeptidase [Syntrophomonadaceae bacterium]